MKFTLIVASLFLTLATQAETLTYEVSGMHCGSCAKMIQDKVCKMDGIETCEVSVGKVIISTKSGITLAQDKVQAEISKAGDYKITASSSSSQIKK